MLGGVERNLEELLAPTPAGKEPKAIQLMKNITWVAVLLLVLLEIVVSIKVGGSPFDFSKATLGGNSGEGDVSTSTSTSTDDAAKKGGLESMMTPEARAKVFGYNFEE
jgi:hypothetical protein